MEPPIFQTAEEGSFFEVAYKDSLKKHEQIGLFQNK